MSQVNCPARPQAGRKQTAPAPP